MSDLSFVAGGFPRLASAAPEGRKAIHSARPEAEPARVLGVPGTKPVILECMASKIGSRIRQPIGTAWTSTPTRSKTAERDFIATEN